VTADGTEDDRQLALLVTAGGTEDSHWLALQRIVP
jgi:hypothetical protein